jgi:hypothetical protein
VSEAGPLQLFLDSNVLTGGIVAPWGLDKAVLSLCAARICRLVLAEDVPVLLSAMQSHPDWLLTHNTAHFTPAVAARTGLQIATPRAFIQALARGLQ